MPFTVQTIADNQTMNEFSTEKNELVEVSVAKDWAGSTANGLQISQISWKAAIEHRLFAFAHLPLISRLVYRSPLQHMVVSHFEGVVSYVDHRATRSSRRGNR